MKPSRRMSAEEVAEIRRLHAEGVSLQEIARRLGRHASHVRLVVRGELHREEAAPASVAEARAAMEAAIEAYVEARLVEDRRTRG